MEAAAKNPPLFLEAFYSGLELSQGYYRLAIPDDELVNDVLRRHNIPLLITNGEIRLTNSTPTPVPVPPPPPTVREEAAQILQESIHRSDERLVANHGREAVQELLWVLESLVTGFRGTTLPTGAVKGTYFNQIMRELKTANPDSTFERAIEWCGQLHGYLSSPTGGGVRHGLDLNSGTLLPIEDARFFCNLIRSYVTYFQGEHQKLVGGA